MQARGYRGGGRAAEYSGGGAIRLSVRDAVMPEPGFVQIRVAYCGICGTDLHILHGHMDHRVSIPQTIGHEMSGTVAAVGAAVEGLTVGQPVTVMPLHWCDDCPACRAGHRHICHNLAFVGIETTGAMQELWTVPASIVLPLPEDLSLAHGALVEPLAVAVHDVRRSRLVDGETALVIGGGPIGQLISIAAQRAGATVILAEPNEERRSFAARHGAIAVDPFVDDLASVVSTHTAGAGADVVFEVAGLAATALSATAHVKTRGRVVIVAIHPEPVPVDLHRVFWRELELIGTRVYEREDFEHAIELVSRSAIPADELITKTVPLTDTLRAFETLADSRAIKVLVDVHG